MPSSALKGKPRQRITGTEIYALIFGLFLGLCIVKFGNPVILDQVIEPPQSLNELLHDAWPLHWANWCLAILAVGGAALAVAKKPRWPGTRWLWILPLIWFGWQLLSATQTVDRHLTTVTLFQFGGCVICFFLGALVVGSGRGWNLVMIGVIAAFTFCCMRAVSQKFFEYPRGRQFLLESQQMGWTNLPPETVEQFEREHVIINSNGVDVANPEILKKYEKGRVQGTLVYPNALAGLVLLLLPMALVNVFAATHTMRRWIHLAAMLLMAGLGAAAMFGSGSKTGWLLALGAGAVWLYRLNWSRRLKWLMVAVVVVGGLVVFAVRFQAYFAKGATSVSARFDYWRVAARVAMEKPLVGSGPGTFQRPYERMKQPEAEMARLVHNDYLEQFSDSGMVGGLAYVVWVGSMLWLLTRGTLSWEHPTYNIQHTTSNEGSRVEGRGNLPLSPGTSSPRPQDLFSSRDPSSGLRPPSPAPAGEGQSPPLHGGEGEQRGLSESLVVWLPFAVLLGLLAWFIQGFMEFSLYVPALAWTAFTLAGCLLGRLADGGGAHGVTRPTTLPKQVDKTRPAV